MTAISFSYDGQAAAFDARTGLSDVVAGKISKAIVALCGIKPGGTVVELGAGTGEIGICLARQNLNYIGLDNSIGMLDEFRARSRQQKIELLCCDANQLWPIKDQSAHLIFGSRVFHLLDVKHIVREVLRVAHAPGAVLVTGRVKRSKDSVQAQMRSRMHALLIDHGLTPRPSKRIRGDLLASLSAHGRLLEPTLAAVWDKAVRPADSVRNWMSKESMGGIVPPGAIKTAILEELMTWAANKFGSAETPCISTERYVLEGVQLSNKKN